MVVLQIFSSTWVICGLLASVIEYFIITGTNWRTPSMTLTQKNIVPLVDPNVWLPSYMLRVRVVMLNGKL